MKKILIALSIALASCQTPTFLQAPAPLAASTIDEKTLVLALQTFDTALTAVDRLIAVGVIKPGSPRAVQMADAIHKAKVAYQAASAAQRAGNTTSYLTALSQAKLAVGEMSTLIGSN